MFNRAVQLLVSALIRLGLGSVKNQTTGKHVFIVAPCVYIVYIFELFAIEFLCSDETGDNVFQKRNKFNYILIIQ